MAPRPRGTVPSLVRLVERDMDSMLGLDTFSPPVVCFVASVRPCLVILSAIAVH